MPKILVVDDDQSLCWILKNLFEDINYHVDVAHDVVAAKQYIEQFVYDALILDWELGEGVSGTSMLKHLRAKGFSTPCLMLTGRRDESSCEYGLLEAGADDYLTKPFSSIELKARVHTIMRRGKTIIGDEVQVGDLSLTRSTSTLSYGDQSVTLHRHEFLVLDLLMRHPGEFYTAEAMLARLWSSDSEVSLDNVRMHVSKVRKKLRTVNVEHVLETERGLGYRIVPKLKS